MNESRACTGYYMLFSSEMLMFYCCRIQLSRVYTCVSSGWGARQNSLACWYSPAYTLYQFRQCGGKAGRIDILTPSVSVCFRPLPVAPTDLDKSLPLFNTPNVCFRPADSANSCMLIKAMSPTPSSLHWSNKKPCFFLLIGGVGMCVIRSPGTGNMWLLAVWQRSQMTRMERKLSPTSCCGDPSVSLVEMCGWQYMVCMHVCVRVCERGAVCSPGFRLSMLL